MEIHLNSSEEKIRSSFNGHKNPSKRNEMDLETFKFFLNLLVVDQSDTLVALSGIEPLENPYIKDILNLTNGYVNDFDFHCAIWTNGVNIYKYINDYPQFTRFNINIKSPQILEEKWDELIFSLDKLQERGFMAKRVQGVRSYRDVIGVTLGCALIEEVTDYSYFFELLDKYGLREARVCISLPSSKQDKDSYFIKMKPIFLDFIQKAWERDIPLIYECNNIPPCYFESRELFLASVYNCNGIRAMGWCPRVFQVMPDRTVQLCPCIKETSKEKILNFQNLKDVGNKMFDLRKQIEEKKYMPKCENCILKSVKMCFGGCLGFEGDDNNE